MGRARHPAGYPGDDAMKRRDWLKVLGAAAGTAVVVRRGEAQEQTAGGGDPVAVLVDTTRCIGCRGCEFACAEANGLPQPDPDLEPGPARDTTTSQWTVVKGYE